MQVELIKRALSGSNLKRALWVALIVGTILNLINQGDALFSGSPINYFKLALTYFVPFCVSTYGIVTGLRAR